MMRRNELRQFVSLGALLLLATPCAVQGFTFQVPRTATTVTPAAFSTTTATTALWAKKKTPKSAALEALEALDAFDDDAPMSKKEQKELAKKQAKEQKKAGAEAPEPAAAAPPAAKPMSKKEQMLAKALALEALDEAAAAPAADDDTPQLSKKELKELKKKEAKQQEKEEKKRQKKQAAAAARAEEEGAPVEAAAEEEEDAMAQPTNGEATETADGPVQVTLEDKVRKDRPPPRIRVMESAQPGYTSLRLEGVGVTFRNQEVLKDVTWGVQTGDRIGLVGANGAGKTTQLRILAGELEPTTGDVVKSSKDLRVAMLRQEFVD